MSIYGWSNSCIFDKYQVPEHITKKKMHAKDMFYHLHIASVAQARITVDM